MDVKLKKPTEISPFFRLQLNGLLGFYTGFSCAMEEGIEPDIVELELSRANIIQLRDFLKDKIKGSLLRDEE